LSQLCKTSPERRFATSSPHRTIPPIIKQILAPKNAFNMTNHVYSSSAKSTDGDDKMKDFLGGKSDNLVEMPKKVFPCRRASRSPLRFVLRLTTTAKSSPRNSARIVSLTIGLVHYIKK
jgi:hypothetical protein